AVTSSPSAVIETNFLKAHSAGRHLRINPIFIGCSYLATALILCMSPLTAFAQSERRNIVRVFMDNFGWGELGTYTGLAFRDINIGKGLRQHEGRSFKSCVLGCARFVPEPGQNIHFPLSKTKQAGFVSSLPTCRNGPGLN